jgi:hypothetical protein
MTMYQGNSIVLNIWIIIIIIIFLHVFRSLDLFRHRRVVIVSWGVHDLFFFFFFFFFFCRARWLMPPDVPQPVRLIVLTLL